MHTAPPNSKPLDEEPDSLLQRLRTSLKDANTNLPKLYDAAFASYRNDPAWSVLEEHKTRSVLEIRQLLRQILHDFDRSAASDGSWPDTEYSAYMEHDPGRLVEVYCSDSRGLRVTLDFSSHQFELEVKQFPQGTTIPRPNWHGALTEEQQRIMQQGEGVDIWEVLEGLAQ